MSRLQYASDSLVNRIKSAVVSNYAAYSYCLSLILYKRGQKEQAYKLLDSSIEAVDKLKDSLSNNQNITENRQKLAAQFYFLYQKKVEYLLEEGYVTQAFSVADKAKNSLGEAVEVDHFGLGGFFSAVFGMLSNLGVGSNSIQLGVDYKTKLKLSENKLELYFRAWKFLYKKTFSIFRNNKRFSPFADDLDETNARLHERLCEIIEDHTLVISWYLCSDFLCVFLIDRYNDKPLILKSSYDQYLGLPDWLDKYQNCIRNQDAKAITKELENLLKEGTSLLQIDRAIDEFYDPRKHKKLIIVPHRYLNVFPIHIFSVITGSQKTYLRDLFPNGVIFSPSCGFVLSSRIGPTTNYYDQGSFIALKNPALPYGDIEVRTIGKNFRESEIVDGTYVEEYTKKEMSGRPDSTESMILFMKLSKARYIHFACHGGFFPKNPLKSSLALTNSVYGMWSLEMLLNYNFSDCRLAVLSACVTGVTDTEDYASTYLSLAYAFLCNGCFNVVCSLWNVDDRATAILMIRFYEYLTSDMYCSIPRALSHAQAWLRDSTASELKQWITDQAWTRRDKADAKAAIERSASNDSEKPYSSPFYWGSFYSVSKE